MRLTILLLAALATACTPAPTRREIPDALASPRPPLADAVEADVEVPAELALERVAQGLRVRGFMISDLRVRTGSVEAGSTGPLARGWADCPTMAYRSQFDSGIRGRRTEIADVTARVSARVEPLTPTSARVAVRAVHVARYVNSFTGTPRTTGCPSTGVLEQQLIDAVRLGPA
jgi:hypothetical protein